MLVAEKLHPTDRQIKTMRIDMEENYHYKK